MGWFVVWNACGRSRWGGLLCGMLVRGVGGVVCCVESSWKVYVLVRRLSYEKYRVQSALYEFIDTIMGQL